MISSVEILLEIEWLCDNLQKINGKPIKSKLDDIWVETSASLRGWGAILTLSWNKFHGHFGIMLSYQLFIELLAVFLH